MGILSVAIICNFQSFFFFFYIAVAVDVISLYDLKYRAMQSIRNEEENKFLSLFEDENREFKVDWNGIIKVLSSYF